MKKYEVCVVSKEYRWVTVDADDDIAAKDAVWAGIENILNRKPEDYDTDVYIEAEITNV